MLEVRRGSQRWCPWGSAGGRNPAWNPLPSWSALLDVRDHQWEVAVPFCAGIPAAAAAVDVRVAIELHPGNMWSNPQTPQPGR